MQSKVCYFEIPFKLPSLNDYIKACRANAYAGAEMKKKVESDITPFLARLPIFYKPVFLTFNWVESNLKRDADNIAFAKKFILDSLVKSGKLKDDSRKYVKGFKDNFYSATGTKVIVKIEELKINEKNNLF